MSRTSRAGDADPVRPSEGPVPGLSLYQYDACPFCARVRSVVDRLGLEIEIRDTLYDGARREELLLATGRRTVPVLRIEEPDGSVRWLPESADIIDYLSARFG